MSVNSRFYSPYFDIINTNDMLIIAVCGEPGYNGGCTRDTGSPDAGGRKWCVLSNHHCAGCISGCATIGSHGTDADSMRLLFSQLK